MLSGSRHPRSIHISIGRSSQSHKWSLYHHPEITLSWWGLKRLTIIDVNKWDMYVVVALFFVERERERERGTYDELQVITNV